MKPELSLSTRDFLGKAVLILIFGALAAVKAAGLVAFLGDWPGSTPRPVLDLAAHVASLAFVLLLVAMTMFRLKPNSTAVGLEPKVSALAGTFAALTLAFLPLADLSPAWRIVSISLGLGGCLLSILALFWLGRSFSVMADARRLVTRGPYSIVRHPLYLSEEIATIGIMIGCISTAAVAIVAAHFAIQVRRMFNEERVLRRAFPEYAAYAAETPMIVPRLMRTFRQLVPQRPS